MRYNGQLADKTEVISPNKAVTADFIATDRSEMLVPATNSFLFFNFCRDEQRMNYLHMRNFVDLVMKFTTDRLLY